MSRSLLLGFRAFLVLLGAASAAHALWLYSNFPAGGNGDASLGAARALEVSAGLALAALLCLLLTFVSWRAGAGARETRAGKPPDAGRAAD